MNFACFAVLLNFTALVVILLSLTQSSVCQVIADADYDDSPKSPSVPVFVNVYTHPKTGFTCADKQAGQYYADPETKCAVYYVCTATPAGNLSPQSFACPNGTIFSQATRVCAPHDQVFCRLAERYYENVHGNIDSKGQEELYQPPALQPWRKNEHRSRPKPQSQPKPQTQQAPPSPPQQPAQQQIRRPSLITSTTTTTTAAPEYEYEYIDLPANETNANVASRSKREAQNSRRKGELPSPFDYLSKPHIITSFTCEDKVPGIGYADTETNCKMFHVCIPIVKGKLRDYQLHCDDGKAFNQEIASCDHETNFKCSRSHKFYLFNKWFRPDRARKDSWRRILKKGIISRKS